MLSVKAPPVSHSRVEMPGVVTNKQLPLLRQIFDQHRTARPGLLLLLVSPSSLRLVFCVIIEEIHQIVDLSYSVLQIEISVRKIILTRLLQEALSDSVHLLVEKIYHVPVVTSSMFLHILSYESLIDFQDLFEVITGFFALLVNTENIRDKF